MNLRAGTVFACNTGYPIDGLLYNYICPDPYAARTDCILPISPLLEPLSGKTSISAEISRP